MVGEGALRNMVDNVVDYSFAKQAQEFFKHFLH